MRSDHLDDEQAAAAARDGDLDAYEQLVTRYTALAHRAAYLLGAGDDAEDVVQEAFVKAYRALDSFRPGATFRPWLLRIVANEARNLHRSLRRRRDREMRLASIPTAAGLDGPEVMTEANAARAALLEAVRGLPEKDRRVITCRYFLDLSEAETAAVLGWPRGTVKSRLARALSRLRPTVSHLREEARD